LKNYINVFIIFNSKITQISFPGSSYIGNVGPINYQGQRHLTNDCNRSIDC